MKIARVFPRKTNATPNDDLVFFDAPPTLTLPEIDEVHVSVTFTYDREKAESLAYQWESIGVPVKVGGPAYGDTVFSVYWCPTCEEYANRHFESGDEISEGEIYENDPEGWESIKKEQEETK